MTTGSTDLAERTWPELEGAGSLVLVVPLGSTEQHGPHLPLGTDTAVAVALAHRLAAARPDVVVAPALPYGSSGEHAGFPGTLSIGQSALEALLMELVRSADAFAGTLLLSAHGGNAAPLARAARRLTEEGRDTRTWSPSAVGPGHDAHAGRTETSLMLALHPHQVRTDRLQAGARQPVGELMADLRRGGVAAVSANGVLGDPTGADPDEGARLLETWGAQLVADLAGWPAPPTGDGR